MMTLDAMKRKLENQLTEKRYIHSLHVMETAAGLAERYHVNVRKAELAGLLHDCARELCGDEAFELCRRFRIEVDAVMRHQPELLHGPLGACIAGAEYGIVDREILRAIHCHTTGTENMSMLDKVLFLADYIEPGRKFAGVEEIRKAAFRDIAEALRMSFDNTLKHVLDKGALIHPDTVKARNYLMLEAIKTETKV